MKKIIIVLFILLFVYLFNSNECDLVNDAIRFRVISNSNSAFDILMKEKVAIEISDIILKKGNKDEVKNYIIDNISNIETRIDTLFDNNNYDKTYNIVYGMNEFPEKEYKGVTYPSGMYESLVIEIGDAKGDNYWCFLYPSLCMMDDEKENNGVIHESKIYNFIKDLFM